ncbi:MAG: hypothetical protein PHU23_15790 [Dehalococcoidales bacterium]|nr:hypothetical protein [Dehalococcoidales bacterium]
MKVYLSKRGDKPLLLSLDSENKGEAQILMEMANAVPVLVITSSGSDIEGRVRIQYKAADISIRDIVPGVIE